MKKRVSLLIVIILLLSGCSKITESESTEAAVGAPQRVVALTSSLADVWQLAGGELVGATNDAFKDQNLNLDPKLVTDIGTVKEPNMELIFSLSPDIIIMSEDIPGQADLVTAFEGAGIKCLLQKIETFEDYLSVLGTFTAITGRDDLYEKNGLAIKEQIDNLLAKRPVEEAPTVLFLRASASNVKAIAKNNATAAMLDNIGAINIAKVKESLLEDLSMEVILEEDPDYILVTTMGDDTEKAELSLQEALTANPAWANLSAVKNGNFKMIPREMFHYKPNVRWGEAYEYLLQILYKDEYK